MNLEVLIQIEVGLETAEEGLKNLLVETAEETGDVAEAETAVIMCLIDRVSDALRDLKLYRNILQEGGFSPEDDDSVLCERCMAVTPKKG